MGAGWGCQGGHHKPEQQLPGEGRAADSRLKEGRALSWGPGGGREGRRRVQSPPARGLVGAEAVGSWPVLPAAATWPGYAHGRTYGAMRGAGTLHRTQTHTQLQAAVQEAGPGRSGSGWGHLSKATRKLPGSNENMSFRLKAAGEQELKIFNRNGGLSGWGWGGVRPGVQS